MPTIQLKAKLQAYSRAPFYGDYIRQPSSVTENYNKDTIYVLKDGSWIDLAKASEELGISVEALRAEVNDKFDNIRIEQDATNPAKILFYDSNDSPTEITLPSAVVDNITIGVNPDNQLYTINNPDEKTIKTIITTVGDSDNIQESFDVQNSGEYRVQAIYKLEDPTVALSDIDKQDFNQKYISGFDIANRLAKSEKNISDLEAFIQGKGGFLDPYNFGQALTNLSELDKNNALTEYAKQQLNTDEIPDQTKVKNLYTGNIWVYISDKNVWVNEGQDTIVTATNDGVLGAVTGVEYDENDSNTKFRISIEKDESGLSTGKMLVNGLKEEFQKVVYKSIGNDDSQPIPNTYALRTNTGAIRATEAIEDSDVINQGQFNSWINSVAMTDLEVEALVEEYFKPVQNGGMN